MSTFFTFTESAEFERFWSLVIAAAGQHGTVEERPDRGVIRVGQAPDHVECGLLNLAQSCATAGAASWEEIVERHFEVLADSPMRRVGRLTGHSPWRARICARGWCLR